MYGTIFGKDIIVDGFRMEPEPLKETPEKESEIEQNAYAILPL